MNILKYVLAAIFCYTIPSQVSAQDASPDAVLKYYNELQTFYDENGGTDYEKSALYHAFKNIIPIKNSEYDQKDNSVVMRLLVDNAFLADEVDSATMDESEDNLDDISGLFGDNEEIDDSANLDDDDYSEDIATLFDEDEEVDDSASLDDTSDGDSDGESDEESALSNELSDTNEDQYTNDDMDENLDDVSGLFNESENDYTQADSRWNDNNSGANRRNSSYGNSDNMQNNGYYGSNSAPNNYGSNNYGSNIVRQFNGGNPSYNRQTYPQTELDDETNYDNPNNMSNGMNSYGQTPFAQSNRRVPAQMLDDQYDGQDDEDQDFNQERNHRRRNDNPQYEDEQSDRPRNRTLRRNRNDDPDQYDEPNQEGNSPRNSRTFERVDTPNLDDDNPRQRYPDSTNSNNTSRDNMSNNVPQNGNVLPNNGPDMQSNNIPNNILQSQPLGNVQSEPISVGTQQNMQPNDMQQQNVYHNNMQQNGQYGNMQQSMPPVNERQLPVAVDNTSKVKKVKRRSNPSRNRKEERPCYILYPCQYPYYNIPCSNPYFAIPNTCPQNNGCEAIDYKKQKYIQKVNDLWVLS